MKTLRVYVTALILISGCWVLVQPAPGSGNPIVVDRNLFSPDRKPPPPDAGSPATESATPTVPPKALQLDGIMVYGEMKKALVRMKAPAPGQSKGKGKESSPFISVREGEKISDYVVKKIGMKSISVEKGGQTFDIHLYASGKVLPPLPAPPPSNPTNEPSPGERGGQRPPPNPQSPEGAGDAANPQSGNPAGMNSGEGNVDRGNRQLSRQRPNMPPPPETQNPDEEVVEEEQAEEGGSPE